MYAPPQQHHKINECVSVSHARKYAWPHMNVSLPFGNEKNVEQDLKKKICPWINANSNQIIFIPKEFEQESIFKNRIFW